MKTVNINIGEPYAVHVGIGILSRCGKRIAKLSHQDYKQVVIITDNTVADLYGSVVADSVRSSGYSVNIFSIEDGSVGKNIETALEIVEFLAGENFTNEDLIVALGGSSVIDVAGFVASVYRGGVDYVQIPTTFIASVESSVGGSNGLNTSEVRDLFGTTYHPRLVICDAETFFSLTGDSFVDGVAEAIKYGCIWDAELLDTVATDGITQNHLVEVISKCIETKMKIIAEDEYDAGIRKFLKFGDTVGHAIEILSNYTVSRGKAIAVGMFVATKAGEKAGITEPGTTSRVLEALVRCNLPSKCEYRFSEIAEICKRERKRSREDVDFVILQKIGKAGIHRVSPDELEKFMKA